MQLEREKFALWNYYPEISVDYYCRAVLTKFGIYFSPTPNNFLCYKKKNYLELCFTNTI